jgi:type I restriction enzyme S subunit
MIKTTQYKNTSIGPIPTDWELVKIKDIGQVKRGAGSQYLEYVNEEGIRFIRINDFFEDKPVYIKDFENINNFLLNERDILFAGTGATAGAVFLPKCEWFNLPHSYNAPRIRVNANQNKSYIFLSLQSNYIEQQKQKAFVGAAQPFLDTKAINDFDIPLPPLPEQQKIADVLSTWDKAIQETDAIIKKLEDRNKALAFSLLRGKLVNKNSKKISLSKFLTFTPREIEKPTENYLALGIRSHGKGIFHKPDSDPKAISMDKLYEVKENDFIVNITFAWEHAVAIISKEDEGGLVSHRFPTYVIDQKIVSVEFFRHIILQPFFKQMLDNISPGGAGRNRVLSKKDLLKLEISVPSLEEQTVIAEVLNTAQQELKQYEEKLKALQQQKKGLMQQLLTGKVRTV